MCPLERFSALEFRLALAGDISKEGLQWCDHLAQGYFMALFTLVEGNIPRPQAPDSSWSVWIWATDMWPPHYGHCFPPMLSAHCLLPHVCMLFLVVSLEWQLRVCAKGASMDRKLDSIGRHHYPVTLHTSMTCVVWDMADLLTASWKGRSGLHTLSQSTAVWACQNLSVTFLCLSFAMSSAFGKSSFFPPQHVGHHSLLFSSPLADTPLPLPSVWEAPYFTSSRALPMCTDL